MEDLAQCPASKVLPPDAILARLESRLKLLVGGALDLPPRQQALRTAQREWAELPASDQSRAALEAYAQGVNDRIAEAESRHQLPAMFTLLGYQPRPWTPIDSLIVKGDMTQTLNFTDTPLVMALLSKTLGPDLTSEWFPVLPPNQQSPYDPGPYPRSVSAYHFGSCSAQK